MEETISSIHLMWSSFLSEATFLEKFLAITNVLGAGITFIISFILFHKIDLVQEKLFDFNIVLIKTTLVIIMIGCFLASLSIRIPTVYEFLLSLGLTSLLAYLLKLTISAEKTLK